MFSMSEKDKNGIILVQRCLRFLTQHIFAFIMCFAIVAINLIILGTFLFIEYYQYGFHIFDLKSLYNLIGISFWNHIGHILILLGIIFLSSLVTIILRIKLTHYLVEILQKKTTKWGFIHIPSLKVFKETLRFSALHSIQIFKKLLHSFDIYDRTTELQFFILDEPMDSVSTLFTTSTFIVLPLIAEEQLSLKEAFEKSEQLLKQQFGKEISSNYSLTAIKIKNSVTIFFVVGGILHFLLNFDIFPTLIICTVITTSIASFFENVTLVLKAALYNCATDKPFEPFTKEEIKRIFY